MLDEEIVVPKVDMEMCFNSKPRRAPIKLSYRKPRIFMQITSGILIPCVFVFPNTFCRFLPLLTAPNEFGIRHYAGEVTYLVDKFLEKVVFVAFSFVLTALIAEQGHLL